MTDTATAAPAASPTSSTESTGLAPQADPASLSRLMANVDAQDTDNATEGGEETEQAAEPEQGGELVKLTVNGKEITKPMGDVVKLAQQAIAAGNIMARVKQERDALKGDQDKLAQANKGVQNFVNLFKRADLDTIAEFVHTHLDAGQAWDQGVIKYALRLYEESKMSPQDRERSNAVRERDKLKQQLEARSKADQDAKNEYEINRAREHIVAEVPKALKAVGLPDTPFVHEQLLGIWRTALDRGQTPTAQAVAQYLKKRLADAGMLKNGQVSEQPTAPKRPRATAASVGGVQTDASQYTSWAQWQKSRGKR